MRRDIWARLMDEVTELEDTQFEQSDDKHTTNVSADWCAIFTIFAEANP